MRNEYSNVKQVREALDMMKSLGLVPDAICLPTADCEPPSQLPRMSTVDIDLDKEDGDGKKRYGLRFGENAYNVAGLLFVKERTDLGTDPEVRSLWIVRQIKPEIDTVEEFRAYAMSLPWFAEPYREALNKVFGN